jgi:hypothetical protein
MNFSTNISNMPKPKQFRDGKTTNELITKLNALEVGSGFYFNNDSTLTPKESNSKMRTNVSRFHSSGDIHRSKKFSIMKLSPDYLKENNVEGYRCAIWRVA